MTDNVTILPNHPRMGRTIVNLDERNREYPMRALFGASQPLTNKYWGRVAAWDQGTTSQCVLYTLKGMAWTEPYRARIKYTTRRQIDPGQLYPLAQRIDEWPGESPEYEGTSVLAGMKLGQQQGFFSTYRWCFGIDDVLQTLSHHGPVAIGIAWYNSMFETSPFGVVEVDTESGLAGGHAVELHGIDVKREIVFGSNSWGREWGYGGRFRMNWSDLDLLLKDQGEAVTATAR